MKIFCHLNQGTRQGQYSTYFLPKQVEASQYHERVLTALYADLIILSIHNVNDVQKAVKLRQEYPNTKIMVGGQGFYLASLLLLYVDYVFCGHAIHIFNEFETFSDLDVHPHILHKGKEHASYRSLTPQEIAEYPIIKTHAGVLCLASLGCERKCPFCSVGWHELKAEHVHIDKLVKIKEAFFKEYAYSNRFRTLGYEFDKRLSYSLSRSYYTIQEYIANSEHFKRDRSIHLNIESPNPALRALFGKPVSNDEICEAISLTKSFQTVVLNFLGGFNHTYEFIDFLSMLPKNKMHKKAKKPQRYKIVINPFVRLPYTPLEDYPLEQLKPLSIRRIGREAKRMNISLYNVETIYSQTKEQSSLRASLLVNARNMKEADLAQRLTNKYGEDRASILSNLGHEGLDYMFNNTHTRRYKVEMPNADLLKKEKQSNKWSYDAINSFIERSE